MPPEPAAGGSALPGQPSSQGPLEMHSKRALEAAGVGTWVWNIRTNDLAWDDVTHRLFGVEPGKFRVSAATMEALVHPSDRESVRADLGRNHAPGAELNGEFRVIWPADGSTHFLRVRGKIEGGVMMGACWDVSERKTMEESLARERFFLQTLAEHIPDHIYFKDAGSRFIWVGREKMRRSGAKAPAEILGKTDFDFFSEEHAAKAFEDEQTIIRTGKPLVNVEERETWPDGRETWVSSTKMPLRGPDGLIIGTFGVSREITDRKRAEQQLAKYAEELRRKNQELEEDLEMARELQNALLPRHYPCFPRNAPPLESALHFSHFFNPSAAVSGDFFDILQLSDTMAGVFICDVMGHGMRSALVAAIVRALVEELKGMAESPGDFLRELNEKLSSILKQTDIPMFASASYVVADIARGEFRHANAGHPHPLCVRHDAAEARAMPLNHYKRGPVLGMFKGAKYETHRYDLSLRDIVFLFTDGLFEVEDAAGQLFDERSLLNAVHRRANLSADEICSGVLTEIRQFSASHEFSDDVCLVSLQVDRLTA